MNVLLDLFRRLLEIRWKLFTMHSAFSCVLFCYVCVFSEFYVLLAGVLVLWFLCPVVRVGVGVCACPLTPFRFEFLVHCCVLFPSSLFRLLYIFG